WLFPPFSFPTSQTVHGQCHESSSTFLKHDERLWPALRRRGEVDVPRPVASPPPRFDCRTTGCRHPSNGLRSWRVDSHTSTRRSLAWVLCRAILHVHGYKDEGTTTIRYVRASERCEGAWSTAPSYARRASGRSSSPLGAKGNRRPTALVSSAASPARR